MVKAFRLGRKLSTESDTARKPRSLLIKLPDEQTQKKVLACAPKLRFSETWGQVYIQPDMSPKEREAHRKVYEELKKQKNEGENNLVIRNGKIVPYIPHSYRTRVITNHSKVSISVSKPTADGIESNASDPEIIKESSAPGDNVSNVHS